MDNRDRQALISYLHFRTRFTLEELAKMPVSMLAHMKYRMVQRDKDHDVGSITAIYDGEISMFGFREKVYNQPYVIAVTRLG